jgi:hypothetical protein
VRDPALPRKKIGEKARKLTGELRLERESTPEEKSAKGGKMKQIKKKKKKLVFKPPNPLTDKKRGRLVVCAQRMDDTCQKST